MSSPTISVHTGGFTFTNGYVFTSPAGNLAVDAPEGMADWLTSRGIRLAGLLLTHWHFDHVMDAARIAREHQCPVAAWGPSTRELRLEDYLKQWARIEVHVEDYPVDEVLAGRAAVTVAGTEFHLEHVPGHSPDSMVFIQEDARLAFTGDTLMKGGVGRDDFPDGDGHLLHQGIREKILTLPGDYRIFPGHGRPSTIREELADNPYFAS